MDKKLAKQSYEKPNTKFLKLKQTKENSKSVNPASTDLSSLVDLDIDVSTEKVASNAKVKDFETLLQDLLDKRSTNVVQLSEELAQSKSLKPSNKDKHSTVLVGKIGCLNKTANVLQISSKTISNGNAMSNFTNLIPVNCNAISLSNAIVRRRNVFVPSCPGTLGIASYSCTFPTNSIDTAYANPLVWSCKTSIASTVAITVNNSFVTTVAPILSGSVVSSSTIARTSIIALSSSMQTPVSLASVKMECGVNSSSIISITQPLVVPIASSPITVKKPAAIVTQDQLPIRICPKAQRPSVVLKPKMSACSSKNPCNPIIQSRRIATSSNIQSAGVLPMDMQTYIAIPIKAFPCRPTQMANVSAKPSIFSPLSLQNANSKVGDQKEKNIKKSSPLVSVSVQPGVDTTPAQCRAHETTLSLSVLSRQHSVNASTSNLPEMGVSSQHLVTGTARSKELATTCACVFGSTYAKISSVVVKNKSIATVSTSLNNPQVCTIPNEAFNQGTLRVTGRKIIVSSNQATFTSTLSRPKLTSSASNVFSFSNLHGNQSTTNCLKTNSTYQVSTLPMVSTSSEQFLRTTCDETARSKSVTLVEISGCPIQHVYYPPSRHVASTVHCPMSLLTPPSRTQTAATATMTASVRTTALLTAPAATTKATLPKTFTVSVIPRINPITTTAKAAAVSVVPESASLGTTATNHIVSVLPVPASITISADTATASVVPRSALLSTSAKTATVSVVPRSALTSTTAKTAAVSVVPLSASTSVPAKITTTVSVVPRSASIRTIAKIATVAASQVSTSLSTIAITEKVSAVHVSTSVSTIAKTATLSAVEVSASGSTIAETAAVSVVPVVTSTEVATMSVKKLKPIKQSQPLKKRKRKQSFSKNSDYDACFSLTQEEADLLKGICSNTSLLKQCNANNITASDVISLIKVVCHGDSATPNHSSLSDDKNQTSRKRRHMNKLNQTIDNSTEVYSKVNIENRKDIFSLIAKNDIDQNLKSEFSDNGRFVEDGSQNRSGTVQLQMSTVNEMLSQQSTSSNNKFTPSFCATNNFVKIEDELDINIDRFPTNSQAFSLPNKDDSQDWVRVFGITLFVQLMIIIFCFVV